MARSWRLFAAGLVLALATVALTGYPDRFEPVGPPLVDSTRLDTPGDGWFVAGLVRAEPGTGVHLAGAGPHPFTLFGRHLGLDAGARYLEVDVTWRARGLVRENPSWPAAGLALQHLNERGERLWFWPWRVIDAPLHTDGWQRAAGRHPLFTEANDRRLFAYVASSSGELAVRQLTLQVVRERPVWAALRVALTLGWLLLGVAVVVSVLRVPGRRLGRLPALGVGAAIVVGGTLPQPWLAYSVGHAQDVARGLQSAVVAVVSEDPNRDSGAADPSATNPGEVSPGAEDATDSAEPATSPDDASEAGDSTGIDGEPSTGAEEAPATDAVPEDDASAVADEEDPDAEAAPSPSPAVPDERRPFSQQLGHSLAFLVLTLFALTAWGASKPALAAVITLSPVVQVLQTLVDTRNAALMDIAFDVGGVLVGLALWQAVRSFRRRTLRPAGAA